jgi:hypothetical protein
MGLFGTPFVLGERFEKLKAYKTVEALNRDAVKMLALIKENHKRAKKEINLTEHEEKQLHSFVKLKEHEIMNDKVLKERGFLTDEHMKQAQSEIEQINAIQNLEEKEKQLLIRIDQTLEELKDTIHTKINDVQKIMHLLYFYMRLETEYVKVQKTIRNEMEAEFTQVKRSEKHAQKMSNSKVKLARHNARLELAENHTFKEVVKEEAIKQEQDKAAHATDFFARGKKLVSESVTALGNIVKGTGEGSGAAISGTGKGIGSAAEGTGEGVGNTARGTGHVAQGIGKAVHGVGKFVMKIFSFGRL